MRKGNDLKMPEINPAEISESLKGSLARPLNSLELPLSGNGQTRASRNMETSGNHALFSRN